jgi:hypothetical protein
LRGCRRSRITQQSLDRPDLYARSSITCYPFLGHQAEKDSRENGNSPCFTLITRNIANISSFCHWYALSLSRAKGKQQEHGRFDPGNVSFIILEILQDAVIPDIIRIFAGILQDL